MVKSAEAIKLNFRECKFCRHDSHKYNCPESGKKYFSDYTSSNPTEFNVH